MGQTATDLERLTYTVNEVATILGKSRDYVLRLVRSGRLPAFRPEGTRGWIIVVAEFDRWLASHGTDEASR